MKKRIRKRKELGVEAIGLNCYNMDCKYEQIVNREILWLKNGIVRIFCELHAEMRLEVRCLCGFQRGTVEMKEARVRALKQRITTMHHRINVRVEMKEARVRVLFSKDICLLFEVAT